MVLLLLPMVKFIISNGNRAAVGALGAMAVFPDLLICFVYWFCQNYTMVSTFQLFSRLFINGSLCPMPTSVLHHIHTYVIYLPQTVHMPITVPLATPPFRSHGFFQKGAAL